MISILVYYKYFIKIQISPRFEPVVWCVFLFTVVNVQVLFFISGSQFTKLLALGNTRGTLGMYTGRGGAYREGLGFFWKEEGFDYKGAWSRVFGGYTLDWHFDIEKRC